ncbi:MAG TPA: HI0074 family nucleotidyltransferase substrate-binding subunit [Candidatus Paceibacterota bacterium]
MSDKLTKQRQDLSRIYRRLSDSLQKEKTSELRDSVIKRFELCTDVFWKTLQSMLNEQFGKALASPKPVIREAIANGIIPADEQYIEIIDLRNELVHNYHEEFADMAYEKIKTYLSLFAPLAEQV